MEKRTDSEQDDVTVDGNMSKYSAHASVHKINRKFSPDKEPMRMLRT